MTISTIYGYCSGMPLLVLDPHKEMFYWEIVIGRTIDDDGTARIVTHRYHRGLPMYDSFGAVQIPYYNYYLETSLNHLMFKEKTVYQALKDEVPPIVYYLN